MQLTSQVKMEKNRIRKNGHTDDNTQSVVDPGSQCDTSLDRGYIQESSVSTLQHVHKADMGTWVCKAYLAQYKDKS